MAAFYDHWNDDGSVTCGTTTSGNCWATISVSSVATMPTQSDYCEIWAHSAVVDSAPVCLKRPLPPFATTKISWTFIEPTCEVVDLITGNPRQTRAPPERLVA
jgi:hypothetical protein